MKKINWKILVIAFIIVHLAAFVGSRFTNTGDWYESVKPGITPPSYVFPIVWTVLFILISISFYLVLMSVGKWKKKAIVVFVINIFLNGLWSYLFFGLQNPGAAFFELILLWITILLMIYTSSKLNRIASYLLIPYLLWVSFAGVLNYLIAFA
jgi:tryptophan-rich sensory protein